ncbi:MAG: hypothetical protein JJ872_01465 [Marivivens sp.]|nr:hypothetical protein [Marivivens sp.]
MISGIRTTLLVLAAIGTAGAAFAQEETDNRVAAEADWGVFVSSDPMECLAVSRPEEMLNTRDGEVVEVRRGETRLFVFYRPGANVNGQVAFTGGYPFAGNSTVEMDVDGTKYELFVEGEWAWPAPEDDATIVAAMKAGSKAVLAGRSGRGTNTQDTFSLIGFTAAVEEAARRCN